MMGITNLSEAVGNKRNEEVVDMLEQALAAAKEGGSTDVFILLRKDGAYIRYSPKVEDVMETIAQFELLKYDMLRRMHN
jgi:hypothetical protein